MQEKYSKKLQKQEAKNTLNQNHLFKTKNKKNTHTHTQISQQSSILIGNDSKYFKKIEIKPCHWD